MLLRCVHQQKQIPTKTITTTTTEGNGKTLVSFGVFNVYRVDVCDGTNYPHCLSFVTEIVKQMGQRGIFCFLGPIRLTFEHNI